MLESREQLTCVLQSYSNTLGWASARSVSRLLVTEDLAWHTGSDLDVQYKVWVSQASHRF